MWAFKRIGNQNVNKYGYAIDKKFKTRRYPAVETVLRNPFSNGSVSVAVTADNTFTAD
jgi:hypothetical protein